ncbi:aldo/keto reductase [Tamlana sedimentorum]|uniref:Protein tas n=2 Tax=Neotamlana sedimentorum TaxID=1435349 RepID=A0A0D7W822_9FLAO|nr:aldo/keto reductase [Tamlana sedimentorum]
MTFGNQNTEAEGHEQLDYAIDKGINFIDTAELYPVPATAETSGRTSEIVGTWLKKSGKREQVVLASKIAGTGDYTAHIRTNGFSKAAINEAIDLELKRLQTDYIDLYQLHWPERETNRFGVRTYTLDTQWEDNFNDILNSLDALVKQGKIKHIGISNENSWGTMRYLQESKTHNLPRIKTIQNAYSLLTRSFETDLAEVSLREHVGLLAYSPMAFGVLSGKYIKGTAEDNARLKLFPRFSRYSGVNATKAATQYLKIAEEHGLTLAQLSLAFVTQQPFVTSTIIGATTMNQLKENIESIEVTLNDDILKQINAVHNDIPNPAV